MTIYNRPRAVANKSLDQSFIFALDFTEDGNEPEEEDAYSVDSTVYGETPFLVLSSETRLTPNVKRKLDALLEVSFQEETVLRLITDERVPSHSCDPTLQIYQVVYDTIFEVFTVACPRGIDIHAVSADEDTLCRFCCKEQNSRWHRVHV